MKKTLLLIGLFSLCVGNTFSQKPDKGLQQITPSILKQYIDYLASDSLMGRNTPSPELDIAADFIAAQFESFGIKKVNGSYFQEIPFCSKNLDNNSCHFTISKDDDLKSFNLKTDYIPFKITGDTAVIGNIVFAGYGITAPEYNYDDYKEIDAKGKIVLVFKEEPGEEDKNSPFNGIQITKHSYLETKVQNAIEHGAVGLLLVNGPLTHIWLKPQGYPWPSLSKFLPQDNLPIELCVQSRNYIPVVHIGEGVVKHLFNSIDSLKNIQKIIDSTYQPFSFPIPDYKCNLKTQTKTNTLIAKNVIGYIDGRNKKMKNELVVIGGHYDHVGYIRNHKQGEDYIFNGADDNASGTAGVLAVAKAFSSMKKSPKRSILFILFAGEEKGLLGSDYYVDNPLFPLNKTVVMLNLDMIGRNGEDTMEITGVKQNPDLCKIIFKENEKIGLKQTVGKEDLFGRSDHYNFYKKNISAVDISSGLHNDYHTVRDNPNTINFIKATKISKLTFRTAWVVANEKKYYKTQNTEK